MSEKVRVPAQMGHLPICPTRGVPIPWFVARIDGKPEFRVADAEKRAMALALGYCWVCGYPVRDRLKHFVLGPMCGLNRISAEPAMHLACANYSVRACPFLTRPRMERRELAQEILCDSTVDGVMIARNPGCMALWSTPVWTTVSDGEGGILVRVGDPEMVDWYAEGRAATRAEVLASIVTGLPHLIQAGIDDAGWEFLAKQWIALDRWLPRV